MIKTLFTHQKRGEMFIKREEQLVGYARCLDFTPVDMGSGLNRLLHGGFTWFQGEYDNHKCAMKLSTGSEDDPYHFYLMIAVALNVGHPLGVYLRRRRDSHYMPQRFNRRAFPRTWLYRKKHHVEKLTPAVREEILRFIQKGQFAPPWNTNILNFLRKPVGRNFYMIDREQILSLIMHHAVLPHAKSIIMYEMPVRGHWSSPVYPPFQEMVKALADLITVATVIEHEMHVAFPPPHIEILD